MSEMKFACPICGQHITAARDATGSRVECPTCFRQLIVPEPREGDSKLILSAAEADRSRSFVSPQPVSQPTPIPRPSAIPMAAVVLAFAGALAIAYYMLGHLVFQKEEKDPLLGVVDLHSLSNPPAWTSPFPVPDQFGWRLHSTNFALPTGPVTGRLNGHGFRAERCTLTAGVLNFRQGGVQQPDLSLSIYLSHRQREVFAGHPLQVRPDQDHPAPRVTLRWKDYSREPATNMISHAFTNGYALRLELGKPESNRISGKIYVALPDEKKSFLGGAFTAEIRQPAKKK